VLAKRSRMAFTCSGVSTPGICSIMARSLLVRSELEVGS
jgi:hypothetical protein